MANLFDTLKNGATTVVKNLNGPGSGANNLGSALGTAGSLSGILNGLSDPNKLLSSLRSFNLPLGGNTFKPMGSTGVTWAGTAADKDWRVRLSLPNISSFKSSYVLKPLVAAGGMIFPYTPGISISHNAGYDEQSITHNNYQFITYQNSKVDRISINAPFFVEDAVQAQYWLAAVHYFRSMTKMFSGAGNGAEQGNPPPIVYLNGYGDFVFKNIPVVVSSFQVELSADTNYISTSMSKDVSRPAGSPAAAPVAQSGGWLSLAGAALQAGGLQNAGAFISGLDNKNKSGSPGQQQQIQAMNGDSHVPVKSTFQISLQPIYSRQAIREFNLQSFVQGAYVNNQIGYN
jgi:hypothetical protein